MSSKFIFQTMHKNKLRAQYCCQYKVQCSWRLFASYNADSNIEVKTIHREHTCTGMVEMGKLANKQSWLRRVVPKHLFVTKATKAQEIIDCIRMTYQEDTSAEAARLAKQYLIQDQRKFQIKQFQQIPVYLELLKQYNSNIIVVLELIEGQDESSFQRVFICPHESQVSFHHMRKFMAVDGTFLKTQFGQILLLAVGIDANGKNLILAWAIVESENTDSWTWFLSHLKSAIPESTGMTLISDRDKGLLAAQDKVYGDSICSLICCFHLKGIFYFFFYFF